MKLEIISDTHEKHQEVKLQGADLLIHCGDFTFSGDEFRIIDFLQWIGDIEKNYTYGCLLIPGNHDASYCYDRKLLWLEAIQMYTDNTIDLWTETYEKGRNIEINGLTFFGFPFTPFPVTKNGFFLEREEYDRLIPNIQKADVIISHGPCWGIHDLGGRQMEHLGSRKLLNKVQEIQPKLFACGHIHEEGGKIEKINGTIFVNAAICNYPEYDAVNSPVQVVL